VSIYLLKQRSIAKAKAKKLKAQLAQSATAAGGLAGRLSVVSSLAIPSTPTAGSVRNGRDIALPSSKPATVTIAGSLNAAK